MTTFRACAGVYGTVDGCVIVSINTSFNDNNEVMCGFIFPPTHHGTRCIDMRFSGICFLSHIPSIITTLTMPKTPGHVIPQNSRQARTLLDSAKRLNAEEYKMESSIEKKCDRAHGLMRPAWRCSYDVCLCTEMDAGQHDRTVQGALDSSNFLETPDVHYDPLAIHAPVASDSSLMSVVSLTMRYKLELYQLEVKHLS